MIGKLHKLAKRLGTLGLYDEARICIGIVNLAHGSPTRADPYGGIATDPMNPLAWIEEDSDDDKCPVCGESC